MSSWWWYLSKASGIVAAVLLVLSWLWGLLFSGRATGRRIKPNWWLALHNWLGGLALVFVAIHIVAVYFDTDAGLGLVNILVPGTATGWAWPIGTGVVATYLFAIVVFTSVNRVKQGLSRRSWYLLHMLSIPAVVLAALHSYQAASDAGAPAYTLLLAALAGMVVYPAVLRIAGIVVVATRRS